MTRCRSRAAKGSGQPGGRDGYADPSLRAPGGESAKYEYTYRVWGRLLYSTAAQPQTWRRYLRREFFDGADTVELSLAHASRILPLVTTAHLPSAANNNYWPEMYENMSIVDAAPPDPYTDSPTPRRFGTVSPLDPQFFSRIDDHVSELIDPNLSLSGKYTPIEVAQWLEDLAQSAEDGYLKAVNEVPDRRIGSWRRYAIDVQVQIGVGRFFAKKFRAAVLYALFENTGSSAAFVAAWTAYTAARKIWADFVDAIGDAYVPDVTYGDGWFQRGNWADRLTLIDRDLALMQQRQPPAPKFAGVTDEAVGELIRQAEGAPPPRPAPGVVHDSPMIFRRGAAVPLALALVENQTTPVSAQLYYRRTDQSEAWNALAMTKEADGFHAEIPTRYTDSPFALTYYFELRDATGLLSLYPGFNAILSNTPYFVLRQMA